MNYLWAFGVLGLIFVFVKNAWVSKQEEGDPKMARIAKNIADGAMSFLKAEYRILAIFVAQLPCSYISKERMRPAPTEWWPFRLL